MRSSSSRRGSAVLAAAFVGALALFVSFAGLRELQADSFRLLYTGRYIAHHGFLHHDPFTVAAAGRAYADQQWLAELLDYEIWRLGGYVALAVVAALIFGSAYALLAAMLSRRGASLPLTVGCCALAMFSSVTLIFVRAQLFVVPLMVLLLWLCLNDSEHGRPRRRTLLVLPLLALWGNLHGSVVIGVAVAFAFLIWRAAVTAATGERRVAAAYLGVALATLLTPLATPYGVHVLAYYQSMFGNHAVRVADIEWDPPAVPSVAFLQYVIPLGVAAGCALAALRKRRLPASPLLLAVVITGAGAALAMRDNIWLGISAAALVGETARGWLPTRELSGPIMRAVGWAAAVLAIFSIARLATRDDAGFLSHTPLRAVAATASYTTSHPCARVLADNRSASALLWLDPSTTGRVAFDGELEVYPEAALLRWVGFQAGSGSGWSSVTTGYPLLLGTSSDHPALVQRLERLPQARVLDGDSTGISVLQTTADTCGEVSNV